MNANLVADGVWMRSCKCNPGRTENTNVVSNVVARAQESGYKAGYNECLTHVNVDATDVYDALVLPALAQAEECLAADDYVDRLRSLFEPKEGAEGENEDEGKD
ncbi:hypothetical protein Hanom_Chr07g00658021 [Helianthus anomalus]